MIEITYLIKELMHPHLMILKIFLTTLYIYYLMFREMNPKGTGTRTSATHSSCHGDQPASVGGVFSSQPNSLRSSSYNNAIATTML